MVNAPGGTSAAAAGTTASGNGSRNMITASRLRPRQPHSYPSARKLSRNAPSPQRGCPLGAEAPGSFEKKRKAAPTEEEQQQEGAGAPSPSGISKAGKPSASASLAPRDPIGASSSEDLAQGCTGERAVVGSAMNLPKKRKCMGTKNYMRFFTAVTARGEAKDVVTRSARSPVPAKTNKVKESPFQNLQKLPDGCHPDFDNDHLYSVNKLREFWHKSQGAVLVDDKERVMKTILFILSVLPDACKPFLLVTTASLSSWKADFSLFAPCINVAVYDGEKDVHKLIQNPEFHENRRHTVLHVLIAHPDIILEDIKNVEGIGWEAVIVDYCQNSVLKHLKQLNQFPTNFRMVLLSSPLKDNLPEYKKLLAFLNSEQEDNEDYVDAKGLAMLKARFARHIAYEQKRASSKFSEYWVPAYLSQAQLELYSSILRKNSSVLQSQTVTDSVAALPDIVMCLRKCCNHPCLVGLQHSPVNTDVTESMDDRMHKSGKLLLLAKMLKEIRNKRLRVIVLFQSDGAVVERMGDILEELVRQRFGPESYERVRDHSAFSVKREAMDRFNDMTKGRFVFLIDSHSCHSSINLSSIDAIIIYDSDLNPLNDLKGLRRIKMESQLKHVHIFRLYTPFTVEEKGLALAKQGIIIGSNTKDITPTLSHCLLSWGVSFLFGRVVELQQDSCASKSYERETVFMDKVVLELLTELSTDVEDSGKVNSATVSKACMSGEFYSRNITLIGEREGVSSLDGDPPIEVPTEETNEARMKRRKTGEIVGSSSEFSSDVIDTDLFPDIGTPSSADLHLLPKTGVENLSTPKSLHAELKRELSELIKVLKLPDNVGFLALHFLEDLLKNHLVVRQPPGILHAFNIALCWRAASLLKYTKLDRQESLALAFDYLNYESNEELTGLFYKKFGILKEKFVHKSGGRSSNIQKNRVSPHESSSANLKSDQMILNLAMDLHGDFTHGTQVIPSATDQMVSDGQELIPCPETYRECHLSTENLPTQEIPTATEQLVSDGQELIPCPETDRECYLSSEKPPTHGTQEIPPATEQMVSDGQELLPCPETDRECHLSSEKPPTHGTQEIPSATEQMVSDGQELVPCPQTDRECHLSSEKTPSRVAMKRIELFNFVFSTREKNIIAKQQVEMLNLRTQRDNQVMKLKEVCNAVVQHIQTSDINEETSSQIKLVIQWFTMLMSAFLAHMRLQIAKLEALQSTARVEEELMKEKLKQEVIFGKLDTLLDLSDAVPDSDFVAEEFIHFTKPNGDDHVDNFLASRCDQLLDDRLMEITVVRNSVPSEAFSTCAVRNEPTEAHMRSGGGAASEHVDHPDANIHCSSDGVDLQRACSASAIPASHDSINQEPSTDDGRSVEHCMRDNTANPSMLSGITPPVVGLNAGNDGTVAADPDNLESPVLASPQNLTTLRHPPAEPELTDTPLAFAMSAQDLQTEMQAKRDNIDGQSMLPGNVTMSVMGINADNDGTVPADPDHLESPILASSQNLTTLQHPPSEVEPTDTPEFAIAAWGHQTEKHTPCPTLDAQHQRMCPDDSGNVELGTATGILQGGTTSDVLGDSSTGIKAKNTGTVPADVLNSENQCYIAPHNPAIFPGAWEVDTQADQSSVPAQHSTSLPAQQNLAISGHPPVEAEPSSSLDPEAAQSLQPDIQPSTSTLDADSSQTGHHPETTPVLSQGGSAYHHLVDGRMGFDVDNHGTVCSQQAHSESPTFAAPQSPVLLAFSSEVGTPANLSSTASLQSNDAPSSYPPEVAESPNVLSTEVELNLHTDVQASAASLQSNDAPSRHPPEVAESLNVLSTEVEQNSHTDLRASTSLLGVPLQRMFPDDSSQTNFQPDRATELAEEGEPEYLTCPTRNPAALPLSRGAEAENGQASLPAQEITGLHAQHSLATPHHSVRDLQPPISILSEEAERTGMMCAAATHSLQHGMQSSLTTQDVPLERTELPGMPVTQSTAVLQREEPSLAPDLQPGMQSSSPMQDQPVEAGVAITSGTISAQNLQPETQPSTSVQHIPPESSRTHPDESIQIGLQPNTTTGPEQLTQFFSVAPAAFNHLPSNSEPLKNELEKLKSFEPVLRKNHEQKKLKIQTEFSQEMEKLKKKYELLFQEEDSMYHRSIAELNGIYKKIAGHQSIAEAFREKFCRLSATQERSPSTTIRQAPQSSQQAQTTTLPSASSIATRQPVLTSFQSRGPYLQASQAARPSAPVEAIQLQSVIAGNPYRGTPSPTGSTALRNGSYGAVGAQPRGPAPHLRQHRMPSPTAMVRGDQWQPGHVGPGITSSRRTAPGTFAVAGVPFPSMASSSVHQAVPSASVSLAGGYPASSMLPQLSGSASESMANFAQLHSTIPVAMASHQAPGLNSDFHHMAAGGGPLTAAAGMRLAGAQTSGADQAGVLEPTLDVRRLPLYQQSPHAMTLSLIQQTVASMTAPSSHSALMTAHQALVGNPGLGGMAGPQNLGGGWHHRARAAVANPSLPGSATANSRSAGRASLAGVAPSVEVVSLSDEEDE
ncbi:hypothetical protein U9M48_025971 [Paspalum notatum var. saurae]|uniref:Helicase C-terminal domain-containing protein n=1 Tax=Paspalum notatum var. saurae TaxID=547442 RepID=A0AAQ3WXP9_PASNO